jgi:hypothetical protein
MNAPFREPKPEREPFVMATLYHYDGIPGVVGPVLLRCFWIGLGPDPVAMHEGSVYFDLESARRPLQEAGMICFPRSPDDAPTIIESWI